MSDYTSKDIKVLDEISHIRNAPGMYIGSTETPTHLLEELLDNALDECLAGYANIVGIYIDTKNSKYTVCDNGRGMPIEDGVPITVSTKMFSGGKFKNMKTAYNISVGIHGVGLTAVNALSNFYEIEIFKNKKHGKFTFENAKIKNELIEDYNKEEKPFSTAISFVPSKKYFEKTIVNMDRIRKRLAVASVELSNSYFILQIDDKKEIINNSDKIKFFEKECINDENVTKILSFSIKHKIESLRVIFCYSFESTMTPRILSSVNLLPVESGGTHINLFFDVLKDILNKSNKNEYKFQQNDVLVGLRAYISLELERPELSGQTKDKLINRKDALKKLFDDISKQISSYFNDNKEDLQVLLEGFDIYRKKLDSKKLKSSSHNKRVSTKFTKLRDCTGVNGELYIVEGDSAAGTLIQCRDPRIHAIFPLRGKIPNVLNAKDILKNKEIAELTQAMGCGIGPNFDLSKLKYSKVIASSDNDYDGYHISSLIAMVYLILFPEIIKSGKFYLASGPLYAVNEGKTFIPLWTEEELKESRDKNRHITYFKGLGEMSPQQLKICLMDEKTRRLIKLEYTNNQNELIKIFTDVEAKRDLLKGKG
jgi:DNA gyrase/topoisomerase IV subunit B